MASDMKYGKVTTERKEFPEGEPLFVLRGQDQLAQKALAAYAQALEKEARRRAKANDSEGESKYLRMVEDVARVAEAFEKWPVKKLPD